jgi:hypothetical protein
MYLRAMNYSFKKIIPSWAAVAYSYNPSYSRGRDQEDHGIMV